MRKFLKIFYRLHDGKFQVRFTQMLVDRKGYKRRRIDRKRVSYRLNSFYLACFSLTSFFGKSLCAYCVPFMSEQPTPSNSSNPEFIFCARMMATNPAEASESVISMEQESEEVVEVKPEAEEVMSMPSQAKNKGKEKVEGLGKPMKWVGVKPHTSLGNVKSPRTVPQNAAAQSEGALPELVDTIKLLQVKVEIPPLQ